MKINVQKAVKAFHPNPSFEQVYFEAVANALDAGATRIKITINLESFDKPDTLNIKIEDNGHGFKDANFSKFCSLLEAESSDHKGLGRLVYLAYFNEIIVESSYEEVNFRRFNFNSNFSDTSETQKQEPSASGTKLEYRYFYGDKIKSYAYLVPQKIKDSLVQHFFPRFLHKKELGESLIIDISLSVTTPKPDQNFVSGTEQFNLSDLPSLEKTTFKDAALDFFQGIDILYSIEKNLEKPKSITTSICIDGRAIDTDLISIDAIPAGYQMLFLFSSDYFVGKTNASRQKLELPDQVTEKLLRATLRREVGRIIAEQIPSVTSENKETEEELNKNFPHLVGYYPQNEPGLIIKADALEEAQRKFFDEQRKLLECENIDETKYAKALELSARALMEYVLYRARIIEKLKTMNPANSESEIHSLIVPMKKSFSAGAFIEDIYNNNVWMLDDKYMSYNTVLSDKSMTEVVREIALDEIEDEGRPDITIVFSADPDVNTKVSVVVVELKKKDVKLAKKEEVVSQLRQRARKLLKYFPHKIERIWFYGITDIDQEFRRSLKEDQFKELFSRGQMFYKPQPIIVDNEDEQFIVDMFVMTYTAFIEDAEARNSTFMRILKARIASFIAQPAQVTAP